MKSKIFLAFNIVLFGITNFVYAQNYQPLSGFEPFSRLANGGMGPVLNMLYQFMVGFAVLLSVIYIIAGGIQYMTTDAFTGKQKGRERITNALIGLLIALGSYAILYTINPDILRVNLSLQSVNIGQYGAGSNSGVTVGPGNINGDRVNTTPSVYPRAELEAMVRESVRNSGLMNLSPADAASFFPNGVVTEDGWVNLIREMIRYESSFNANEVYTENFRNNRGELVQSIGLLQLSYEDFANYGLTRGDLTNPQVNIDTGVAILERLVRQDGFIAGGDNVGGSRYWAVLRAGSGGHRREEISGALTGGN